jgi:hypothetical protein
MVHMSLAMLIMITQMMIETTAATKHPVAALVSFLVISQTPQAIPAIGIRRLRMKQAVKVDWGIESLGGLCSLAGILCAGGA